MNSSVVGQLRTRISSAIMIAEISSDQSDDDVEQYLQDLLFDIVDDIYLVLGCEPDQNLESALLDHFNGGDDRETEQLIIQIYEDFYEGEE